jgi:transcriptional regulator GlxA family with amidase domain
VTAVAMQQGFYELGRFSQYYLAMFGERPSQTLGIAAVQAAEDEIARASRFEPGPRTTP